MKLIVGLGNPGIEYQFTPHNAGFLAVDRIAEECGVVLSNRRGRALTARAKLAGQDVLLAKPETFMNLSGLSVAALVREFEIANPSEDIIVLYDELAIPLGTIRIRERGSANGHNGVKSVSGVLGTEDWIRIRIGVGKPALADGREVKAGGTDYLLSPMRKQELAVLDEVLDRVCDAVEMVLTQGVGAAMNEFNRRSSESDPEAGTDGPKGK
ncbi:MAG TPA: aminoacyl-tRNA hydrolase [Edaphobacter sp.]|nr:aminoacyl-tRNA hydrolase [Edaphobacter sp.]HMF62712.1 aminoacyl-tRNA hydrolase [Edaphobacter sp.]